MAALVAVQVAGTQNLEKTLTLPTGVFRPLSNI